MGTPSTRCCKGCRCTAALVPAEGRDRTPEEEAVFFTALCRWGANPLTIGKAREEVLAANDGAPPKVLDLLQGEAPSP